MDPPACRPSAGRSDEEFEAGRAAAADEGAAVRDKEHLRYYREFRRAWVGAAVGVV